MNAPRLADKDDPAVADFNRFLWRAVGGVALVAAVVVAVLVFFVVRPYEGRTSDLTEEREELQAQVDDLRMQLGSVQVAATEDAALARCRSIVVTAANNAFQDAVLSLADGDVVRTRNLAARAQSLAILREQASAATTAAQCPQIPA